jgi:hypothetical protein
MKKILIILSFLFLASCKKNNPNKEDIKYSDLYKDYLKPESINCFMLLDSLKMYEERKNLNAFIIANQFPKNWVKLDDVKKLILLIESKEKCKCLVDPLSSYIPKQNADIGGYAILFINSFKNKSKIDIGLYSCPETNKNDIEEIQKWWKNYE